MKTSNIGLIGLAVMGENLALNMESKGFTVSVYNRTAPGEEGVVDRFMSGRGKGKNSLYIQFLSLQQIHLQLLQFTVYLCLIRSRHSLHIQGIFIRNLLSGTHIRSLIIFRNAQHCKINAALQADSFLCGLLMICLLYTSPSPRDS